jgi:ABC-type branched-subunit amino acid transport system ATPase component
MLQIQNIKKHFGGIRALNDCSLNVKQHSITGMIGPNGSGKTTLFNVITGFYQPDKGSIQFKGESIQRLKPNQLASQGLVRTFQLSRVFAGMSVLENMKLAAQRQHGEKIWKTLFRPGTVRSQEKTIARKAVELLEFVGLYEKKNEIAGNLSYGQQKLLEFARALMTDPQLLLLDEPTAGVNPVLTEQLIKMIVELRSRGITFFVIEHNMEVVKNLCDHVIVLDYGEKIAEGEFKDIQNDERVIEAYLGRQADNVVANS